MFAVFESIDAIVPHMCICFVDGIVVVVVDDDGGAVAIECRQADIFILYYYTIFHVINYHVMLTYGSAAFETHRIDRSNIERKAK